MPCRSTCASGSGQVRLSSRDFSDYRVLHSSPFLVHHRSPSRLQSVQLPSVRRFSSSPLFLDTLGALWYQSYFLGVDPGDTVTGAAPPPLESVAVSAPGFCNDIYEQPSMKRSVRPRLHFPRNIHSASRASSAPLCTSTLPPSLATVGRPLVPFHL